MEINQTIGSTHQIELLLKQFSNSKTPHAQIFTGNDGCAALALAFYYIQLMLCENIKDGKACNNCIPCNQLKSFNYPDLHFTFPFSSTKTTPQECSEFRPVFVQELKKSLYLTHTRWVDSLNSGNKKLTIPVNESNAIIHSLSLTRHSEKPRFVFLWQPEKLNTNAANKLLKLIEEPSDNTYFILVSHSLKNVLETIQSRCTLFKVPDNSKDEIKAFLQVNTKLTVKETSNIIQQSKNIGEAYDLIDRDPISEENDKNIVLWLRLLFKKDLIGLVKWSEETAKQSRESISHQLETIMQVFNKTLSINTQTKTSSTYASIIELDFERFSPLINPLKLPQIHSNLEKANQHILRNANPKITLLNLSLILSKHIGKA